MAPDASTLAQAGHDDGHHCAIGSQVRVTVAISTVAKMRPRLTEPCSTSTNVSPWSSSHFGS